VLGASNSGMRLVSAASMRLFSRLASLSACSCSRSVAMVSSLASSKAAWVASRYVPSVVPWVLSTHTNTRPSSVFSCLSVPRCMRLRMASSLTPSRRAASWILTRSWVVSRSSPAPPW
jgi:hypothetical protein